MLQQGLAFKGYSVEASDGRLGTVADFLFDDKTWKLRWLVVQTGDWMKDKKVLVHPSAIEKTDPAASALLVKLTRDQVANSPDISSDEPVSRQMEYNLYGYYGVDPMWGGGYYGGNGIAMKMVAPSFAGQAATAGPLGAHGPGDAHLRSLVEVTGYNIHATDGEIGHIESFLIDDESWDIRYLVVDTRNWWFGNHVLLAPAAVTEIVWNLHYVMLNLTCYKIKGSPRWDATGLLDRAYQQLLHAYYGWPDDVMVAHHGITGTATATAAGPTAPPKAAAA